MAVGSGLSDEDPVLGVYLVCDSGGFFLDLDGGQGAIEEVFRWGQLIGAVLADDLAFESAFLHLFMECDVRRVMLVRDVVQNDSDCEIRHGWSLSVVKGGILSNADYEDSGSAHRINNG